MRVLDLVDILKECPQSADIEKIDISIVSKDPVNIRNNRICTFDIMSNAHKNYRTILTFPGSLLNVTSYKLEEDENNGK